MAMANLKKELLLLIPILISIDEGDFLPAPSGFNATTLGRTVTFTWKVITICIQSSSHFINSVSIFSMF